jgi:hypothetical protein
MKVFKMKALCKKTVLWLALYSLSLFLTGLGVAAGDSDDTSRTNLADSQAAEKSEYTILNPTPRELMREFNSDRPDVTEGPFTVDAGHFQAEFSFIEYTYNHDKSNRTDGFSVLPMTLKVGVLNNLDLEMILNPYENILVHGGVSSNHTAGFGDMELRAKLNFWGNDGGVTAGGIIPFISIPTGTGGLSNHHVEGGLILPLAVQLPAGFEMGTMAEFDVNRNEENDGYGLDFVHSITFDHELFDKSEGYIEYVGVSPKGTSHTYLAYFDTGITYAITKDVAVDGGINVGLSKGTDNFTVFTGLTLRY